MRFHGGALTLARLMLAGAIGGFLSIFTSWLITGALFHKYQRLTPATWRPEGPTQYTLSSVVQMLGGTLVGLLYFATGGPARLLTANWLATGLVFGGLLWLAVAAPIHVIFAVYVKLHPRFVVGALLDSLVGLMIVSAACAWAAH